MTKDNLYPLTPCKPMSVTVKNWNFKVDAESSHRKILPDDLAASENISEVRSQFHL